MDFITYAAGVAGAQPQNTGFAGLAMLVVPYLIFFVILYYILIRPQKKKADSHAKMISSLKEGDTVLTSGGIKGEIVGVTEEFFEVRIDKGVKITIKKNSISSLYENK